MRGRMVSLCFYFQVHQPYRLRRYSIFDAGSDYFDDARNSEILRKVARKCYLPALRILLDLLNKHPEFRFAMSITGTAMEQLQAHAPDVVELFKAAATTGRVEFLGETYHHSLAGVYSLAEFHQQVEMHSDLMRLVLGVTPTTFRNTELIYSNALGAEAHALGFGTVLTEGWDAVLGKRKPHWVYRCADAPTRVLVRDYELSDDISFRFSRTDWPTWPLTPDKFAARVKKIRGEVCGLFMDFETFGEHQGEATGIFEFLAGMPEAVLQAGCGFVTPSGAGGASTAPAKGKKGPRRPVNDVLDVPTPISWADAARDLSAWTGNAMQTSTLQELYRLEAAVKQHADPALLADWRKLTTSDHVYYMSTKHYDDGQVHGYFSPYESPYDAYINVMNVLDNLRARLRK